MDSPGNDVKRTEKGDRGILGSMLLHLSGWFVAQTEIAVAVTLILPISSNAYGAYGIF